MSELSDISKRTLDNSDNNAGELPSELYPFSGFLAALGYGLLAAVEQLERIADSMEHPPDELVLAATDSLEQFRSTVRKPGLGEDEAFERHLEGQD